MRRHDRHWIGDTGDGRADLFVYNHEDWGPEYLGVMRSTGTGVTASWSEDWVGEWNLGSVDAFEVCDFEGTGSQAEPLRAQPRLVRHHAGHAGLSLLKIYYRWIHNYRHGRNW